ncbi:class I SAM-dependent methyltransferase [Methylacidiphilales bacterium]|nr:class I SAM-dependent methyltransferase [Candidatus Methylacidiphilales bacterium]
MPSTDQSYLHRNCPTCGVLALDPSWSMKSEPAGETCSFADLQSSWRGFFKDQKHFFTYGRCSSCGQIYDATHFTPEQLSELYRQMGDNTAGLPEALMAQTQRGYFDLLCRQTHFEPGGYLELGPDIGLFTREAIGHFPFSHFWMVEPNQAVHPVLDRLLNERPHTLLDDSEQIEKVPDGSLSLIVAIHVLDHLLEPQQLLGRLMSKLISGGSILVVTHDGESLPARFFGRNWPAYCLQHPQIYSSLTLENSLNRAGFHQVQVKKTVNYFPVTYLLRHFCFAAGLGRVPLPAWSSWTIGLKLGNIAAVGRKA